MKFHKEHLIEICIPVIAVILALIVGSIFIALSGKGIFNSYSALLIGAFGSKASLAETLVKTVPLIFCGLSVAFAFRCGVFNIGAEGQLLIAGVAVACVGYAIKLPAIIHIPLCFLVAIIAGGLWGGLAGYLKARFGAHEVITTIMLNFIALKFTEFLVNGPLREPSGVSPKTPHILESAELLRIIGRLNISIFIALIVTGIIYYLLNRTTAGYEVRAVGFNPLAAEYGGINVAKNVVLAMFISGALAGLAGCCEVLGVFRYFMPDISSDYGFQGIAVALLARNHPIGVLLSALLFGSLSNGATKMQVIAKTPKQIASIIQELVIMFVAADMLVRYFLPKKKKE